MVYDRRSHNIDRLRYALGSYDWTYIIDTTKLHDKYSQFLQVVITVVQQNILCHTVSIGPRDPPFVTPFVKVLLRIDAINYVVQAVWIRLLYPLIKVTTLSLLQAAKKSASYNRPVLRNYGLVLRATAILIPVQPPPTFSCVILTLSISSLHAPLRTIR